MSERKRTVEPRRVRAAGTDFIRQIVAADVESGRYGGRVVTRFPPEPNGYLHVGHAMGICLNFGIAEEFGGRCHLRYDDTNPETESEEFVRAIQEDIRWLGFDWGEHLYFASDYFERMYECAVVLIRKGLAYVDSQPTEGIREGRGTVTEPGVPSPFRDRSVEENLDLFRRMREGAFGDGEHVLRGRIDMASPNMLMRDPVLYRIRHAHHYRQGDDWCIYPLYDYAHCLEDAFEGVTHSICTLEFENNRELYDWVLENVGFQEPRPHQYEWAGLDLEGAVLSKRLIKPLVEAGAVSGWDDPRLATLAAFRRRGVPPEALRLLSELVGVSRAGATTEVAKLDFAIREVLNPSAPRVMTVLDPLKVVLTNYPEGASEEIDAPYFPHDVPLEGSRAVPFSRELLIERADFTQDPPTGFRRLVPGGEVRLRYAYVIRCEAVVTSEDGSVTELRCTYDAGTRGGSTPDGRKVKGTIQWVSAPHALPAEVRLFDRLLEEAPEAEARTASEDGLEPGTAATDVMARVSPSSLVVKPDARIEPSVMNDPVDTRYQFERIGYFRRDPVEGAGGRLVFNRVVSLKDSWSPRAAAGEGGQADRAGARASAAGMPAAGGATERADIPAIDRSGRTSASREAARSADPELAARFERYHRELGLSRERADLLTGSRAASDFFEAARAEHGDADAVAAWIVNDVRGLMGGRPLAELPFDGAALGRLSALVDAGAVSRVAAKEVLARMAEQGGEPAELVEAMGLGEVRGREELAVVVDEVLGRWPEKVGEYRGGRKSLIGLFVGEVMKATGGAADPKAAKTLLRKRLDA
jgi:glutaminyl-tRNA synthetase